MSRAGRPARAPWAGAGADPNGVEGERAAFAAAVVAMAVCALVPRPDDDVLDERGAALATRPG